MALEIPRHSLGFWAWAGQQSQTKEEGVPDVTTRVRGAALRAALHRKPEPRFKRMMDTREWPRLQCLQCLARCA